MNSTANRIKCAVFDLDGTLINTITDLGNACEYVMKKHSFNVCWTEDDYKKFVGNGMKKLVERAFDHTLDEATLNTYLAEFLAYYNEHSLDNTAPYDGIKEQLALLREKGIKMCVVTNKAEASAISIVESLFGKGVFDVIIGQVDGRAVKPDPEGVYEALKRLDCTKDEALYFGDSNVDMLTAQNAGVEAVGVTWGFRSFEELFALSPSVIIDEPKYISKLF